MKSNKPLTREEKIKLLQAVKDGKLHPSALRGPQVYFFYESDLDPGIYSGPDNKKYTQQEYEAFCKDVMKREKDAIIWHEGKTCESTIITYKAQPGNEPLE